MHMDPSGEGAYSSFSKIDTGYELGFLAREFSIFRQANKEVQKGLKWQEGGRFSLERNKVRAEVESAALELEYPQLTLVPMFPSLYRYLRTEELNGALSRGGDNLLVGSGTTLYEALGLSVEQPSQEHVEAVFSDFGTKINSLHHRRAEIARGSLQPDPLPLLPHSILAYEPDRRQTEGFGAANRFFNVNATIVNRRVQESLGSLSNELFQNVVLSRVDPAIFQNTPRALPALMNMVEHGGSFIATIGTGNNQGELSARKQFLDGLVDQFSNAGIKVASKLPQLVEGTGRKLFGPEMVGGIIGRKI